MTDASGDLRFGAIADRSTDVRLATGQEATFTAQLQRVGALKLEAFVVHRSPERFRIVDVWIGNHSQLVGCALRTVAELEAPGALKNWELAYAGQYVSIQVRVVGEGEPAVFSASIYGTLVHRAMAIMDSDPPIYSCICGFTRCCETVEQSRRELYAHLRENGGTP